MSKHKHKNLKETKFQVKGMHCAACEVLITDSLKDDPQIHKVSASTSKGEVVVTHQEKHQPNVERINSKIKPYGYSILPIQAVQEDNSPLIRFTPEKIYFNNQKWKNIFRTGGMLAILIYGFFLIERSGIAGKVMVNAEAGALVYFLFGLVAGASSCAALVGGVILSLSKTWNDQYRSENNRLASFFPHTLFHLGRLVAFIIAGGVLAYLGASIEGAVKVTGPIFAIAAGAIMAVLGLQMINVSWAKKIKLALPKQFSLTAADSTLYNKKSAPLYIGAASILLPCGMTLTAFVTTIASGSFIAGAINMLSFGLGTMIVLSAISIASVGFSVNRNFSAGFNQVAGLLVIFFALFTINAQLNAFGLLSASDIIQAFNQDKVTTAVASAQSSVQTIKMEASAYGYEPTTFSVQAGIPVRWEINNTGASGCINAIIARGLIDGQFPLEKGMNVIEFTPEKPGNYKFSCWMGMVGGTIKVVT